MNIVVLGCGNVAQFYLQHIALSPEAHLLQLYHYRQSETALQLSRQYTAALVTDCAEIRNDADVYLFCVPDRAIAELAAQITLREGQTAIHSAGAQSLDLLQDCGPDRAVVWPLYSIHKDHLPQGRTVPLVIEGASAQATDSAHRFARIVSDHIHQVSSFRQRQYLHLNAVLVNNFTNHLLAISDRICTEQQVPFGLLQPIIAQTLQQAMTAAPESVQTGPARRGDIKTQEAHLQLLQAHPEWVDVYRSLSHSITTMYPSDGVL